MRTIWIVLAIVLCSDEAARAQDRISTAAPTASGIDSLTNASALQFPRANRTAAANSAYFTFISGIPTASGSADSANRNSFALSLASPALADPQPAPAAPDPKFVYGGRDDFRWQLALGISLQVIS